MATTIDVKALHADRTLGLLCQAAATIDVVADRLSMMIADLLPSHPLAAAIFPVLDDLAEEYHRLRLHVTGLPARSAQERQALKVLSGSAEDLEFSALYLSRHAPQLAVGGPVCSIHS